MTTPRFTGEVVPQSGKQLTHIVRVIGRYLFFSLLRQSLKYMLVINKSYGNETRYWKPINNYSRPREKVLSISDQ